MPPPRIVHRASHSAPDSSHSTQAWRTVEMFVPTGLSDDEFTDYIHAHIREIAHEGGDFIDRIAIGFRVAHSVTWWRCSVSYLSGPPGTLGD